MVVDTSIFIDHFRAKDKSTTALFKLSTTNKLFISSVTLYELYIGAPTKDKEIDIRFLTEGLTVLPFSEKESIKAAQIYDTLKKNNKLIEFRDIFIAATCIVNELPIATLNKKHFQRIEELKII
jgi:predicted nucleic acid-binding protein